MAKYVLEVDDALWRLVKVAAALKSVPIKTYIANLLVKAIPSDLKRQKSTMEKAINIEEM